MTNGDKIRALPDEKLAKILLECCNGAAESCSYCPVEEFCNGAFRNRQEWLAWLESEAEK